LIKEHRVYLLLRYKLLLSSQLNFLAIESNLYSLNAYDVKKFLTISLKELYSLKYGIGLKRNKIQHYSPKHDRKSKELLKKYSHREEKRVKDYVHKFLSNLLKKYPLMLFAVEVLNKQETFKDANITHLRNVLRIVWRTRSVFECKLLTLQFSSKGGDLAFHI
ncbi:MAG: transposase, partial [Caldisphaera sp.]|uniref:transposase n=1 Tax=Caldisphaera sp. TaxID=2060322 RepID=UPI003D0BD721